MRLVDCIYFIYMLIRGQICGSILRGEGEGLMDGSQMMDSD